MTYFIMVDCNINHNRRIQVQKSKTFVIMQEYEDMSNKPTHTYRQSSLYSIGCSAPVITVYQLGRNSSDLDGRQKALSLPRHLS